MPATPGNHRTPALRLVPAPSDLDGALRTDLSGGAADRGANSALGASHGPQARQDRRPRSNRSADSASDASGRFVLLVRALAVAARNLGLQAPSFQSPPRSERLNRSIHRYADSGDCVVAVRVRGRPFSAVTADVIEGVVVCNGLGADVASAARDELWRAAENADSYTGRADGQWGEAA